MRSFLAAVVEEELYLLAAVLGAWQRRSNSWRMVAVLGVWRTSSLAATPLLAGGGSGAGAGGPWDPIAF
jgi:hypothetical protein